jgi:8-oxo-dGTP pyrophosphatase MutT (NUDIX family)
MKVISDIMMNNNPSGKHTDDKNWRVQNTSLRGKKNKNKKKYEYVKNIRQSAGIACCRLNVNTDIPEILLVKKRYTYSFAAFVFGQYKKGDDKNLKDLFNDMTLQEKIDILSLKFDMLWYKIWLEIPDIIIYPIYTYDMISSVEASVRTLEITEKHKTLHLSYKNRDSGSISRSEFYEKTKKLFDTTYVSDEGVRLKSLISDTFNSELMWEIPKGRRNKKETIINCAIREFKEETGVDSGLYDIIPNTEPVVESYISANTKYTHIYYTAHTSKIFNPTVSVKYVAQISEIDSIRWVGLDEIKFVDRCGRLYETVQRVFDVYLSAQLHALRI